MLSTVERARGRWVQILPQFGISSTFLTNRHGPCPLCGGRDRFRFDDRDGSGSYFCNQCGPGGGLILIRKKCGLDYATACREVDKFIGNSVPIKTSTITANPTNKAAPIERLLDEATNPTVVAKYLAKRGISATSSVLRGHGACPYFDENGTLLGRYPAVVAPIIGPDGTLQSALRIYDADVEPKKKIMSPVTTINGGAVRLHPPIDGVLGVAEGLETALACHELFGIPTWAALSENGIKTFEVPATVWHLVIFGDCDGNFVGQDAAYSLARRIARTRSEISVEVRIPVDAGSDWLDVLNQKARP